MMMRDINFFSKYHVAPKKTSPKAMLAMIAGVAVVLGLLGWIGLLFVSNNNLEAQIKKAQVTLQSPEVAQQLAEIDALEKEISQVQWDKDIFVKLEGDFQRVHRVNKAFMTFLQNRLTRNLTFEDIEIQNEAVIINGISKERLSIAKFEEELRKTEKFNHIIVSEVTLNDELTVNENEPVYNFNMQIVTKDVDFNE